MDEQSPGKYTYVDNVVVMEGLVAHMQRAKRIAIDTEADSLHHYYEKVCLIQLTIEGENYIVDPLAGMDLSQFLDVLASKPLVLHAAEYDLRMMRASMEFHSRNTVFDTMLAGQLLGHEQLGLVAMVEQFLGVPLSKKGQKSDWSRRPLTRAQLKYACDDTRFLEPLADLVEVALRKSGRLEWHSETCKNVVMATERDKNYHPDDEWRIKGYSRLDRRQLAYLQKIWHWREEEAKRSDRPRFKIMGNQQILELAVWAIDHPQSSVVHGPKLPRNCAGRRLRMLTKAISKAHNMRESEWPERRKRKDSSRRSSSDYTQKAEVLMKECSRIAEKLALPAPVLAPRAALEAIARKKPMTIEDIMEIGPLMRWQAELVRLAVKQVFG